MVEYLIVIAVVAVAAIGAWTAFGSALAAKTDEQSEHILAMSGSHAGHGEVIALPPSRTTSSVSRPVRGSLTATKWDESVALAAAISEARGSATDPDVARVDRALERMPPGVLRRLQADGVDVLVGRGSVTDAIPALRGVRPRGWPEGKTWDHVDGAYYPTSGDVVIATTDVGRGKRGLTRRDSESVLYHEIGHALDYKAGYPSRSEAFRDAYEADSKKLTGYEQQGGHAGPEEAYAESFRRYLMGDPNLRKHQPNLWAYWNSDPLDVFGDEGDD